jgi:hypothetical protein
MNFIKYYPNIIEALPKLTMSKLYDPKNGISPYKVTGLNSLKRAINLIEDVPYIENEVESLKSAWLYDSLKDKLSIGSNEISEVEKLLSTLKIKLTTFKEITESSKLFNSSDTIIIRLSKIGSFDNLKKYADDLKKAIEIPILDDSIKGNAKIISADEGSIILFVTLGTITAVKLVAGICWAAAVVKKKRAEAEIFEQHAKTLKLKNDALGSLIDAQKIQLKGILDAEAAAIANKEYNHNEPEAIERLKLSISTVCDLIDRGVQILPTSKDDDIQKCFPDYKNLSLIESTIKQIAK